MTPTAQRLLHHLQTCAVAAANTMSFADIQAGNMVPVDDPSRALPLGAVRTVRGALAEGTGLDVVIALTDGQSDAACSSTGSTDLGRALAPVVQGVVGGLASLVGLPLELTETYELGVGEPLQPAGTEAFTAGLFVDEEQVGNVMFFVAPGALAPPEPEIVATSFPDATLPAPSDDPEVNPLALLRGVEMRITAELGRTRLPVAHVLELGAGSVVELDRIAGTPIDVLANGTVIARGEVVVVDDEYGVRITEIVGVEDLG